MTQYYGDFEEDATVYIPFNTFSSDDPAASVTITNLADADVKVHKDGGTTQIATDGATVAIDYDSIMGNHLITIDTSAHADYTTGAEYQVRVEGTTVDAATINAWVGSFSIERAGGALALSKLIRNTQVAFSGGVVDSGDANTIVDAALLVASGDDAYKGMQVQMTGGTAANLNAVRTITSSSASADSIDFAPDLPASVAADDTFILLAGNYGVIEVDSNNRVDVGAVAGTSQTAGDLADLITTLDTVVDLLNLGIIYGSAETGTLSTTQCTTDLTGYADDELIGRRIVFCTGTAAGQASTITDYANSSGLVTFDAIENAPANADIFKIV